MKVVKLITYYLLGIFTIICVSIFPQYLSTKGMPDASGYIKQLALFVAELVNPDSWLYAVQGSPGKFPIMEVLWPPFIYSMQILIGALLVGFIIAFCLAFSATFLPRFILHPIKKLLDFLESIPDLIIATLLQLFAVYIYQISGIHVFRVASYTEQAYLAPIITLAILPAVSMFKIVLLMIEEEFLKVYVVFARSKGINKLGILAKHILRNIIPISFVHMKIIIWGTLSSQFIIERVFNVHGITYFLLESFTPMTITFSLILIYTPFYFFFQIVEFWLKENQVQSYQLRRDYRWGKWSLRNSVEWIKQSIVNISYSIKHINLKNKSLWHPVKNVLFLFGRHMKNWKFALGSLFFIITISYSLIYSVTTDNHVDQVRLLYEDDGVTLIGAMPFAPTEPFFFGSDRLGFSLFDQLVIGAKYTLIFALLIAFLRVIGGLLLGAIYAFYLRPKFQKGLEKLVDSIHFLPLSLISYILLRPILMPSFQGFTYSFTERILLEIMILTILVVPLTTVLIGKEMRRVQEYEFISSAKVLGGSRFHVFWQHILPHIGPRLTILFGTQFIQVLLIFIHLGVFDFFFGGTKIMMGDPPTSLTNEWSGLIGQIGRNAIGSGRYWFLWVLVAFMLAIFAMQFIVQGVKEVQQVKVGVLYKYPKLRRKNDKTRLSDTKSYKLSKESFNKIEREL